MARVRADIHRIVDRPGAPCAASWRVAERRPGARKASPNSSAARCLLSGASIACTSTRMPTSDAAAEKLYGAGKIAPRAEAGARAMTACRAELLRKNSTSTIFTRAALSPNVMS